MKKVPSLRFKRLDMSASQAMVPSLVSFKQAFGCAIVAVLAYLGQVAATDSDPEVPLWYESNRVHFHANLSPTRHPLSESFITLPQDRVAGLGGKVMVRAIKGAAETPFWYSTNSQSEGTKALREMIRSAHAKGIRLIGYYWHMSDRAAESANPDWICRDKRGRPISSPRGVHLDITGEYRRYLLGRLMVAAQQGIDGFYFDFRHLPRSECFGSALEASYRMRFKRAPPDKSSSLDESREWASFRADRIEDTFEYLIGELRTSYPDLIFILSNSELAGLTTFDANSGLASVGIPKVEYEDPFRKRPTGFAFVNSNLARPPRDLQLLAGVAFVRDAGYGIPPHVWAPGFKNVAHALGFANSVLLMGGIVSLHARDEFYLADSYTSVPRGSSLRALEAVAALGEKVSSSMRSARPLGWAGIYFSEAGRNRSGISYIEFWERAIWPFLGAFEATQRAGLPVIVINDEQLLDPEYMRTVKYVVVPTPAILGKEQSDALVAYERRGGRVVVLQDGLEWHRRGLHEEILNEAKLALEAVRTASPVVVESGANIRHGTFYRNNGCHGSEYLVAIMPPFDWVQPIVPRIENPGEVGTPRNRVLGPNIVITVSGSAFSHGQSVEARSLMRDAKLDVKRKKRGWSVAVPGRIEFDIVLIRPANISIVFEAQVVH